MCGIVAILDHKNVPASEAVNRGLGSLSHRGPDASRIWKSDQGNVILGHRRLSIIDLNSGDQPLSNEDGTIHAIVNGEFYGFEQIRTELEGRGHRFRTQTDSEIVLHLYEEYGRGCLDKLRGEFAFVLWDEKTKTLFAARDRFGIKPLFYSRSLGQLSIASEVKALHAVGIEAAWSDDVMLQMIGLNNSTSGKSHFRDIEILPPAHYIVASQKSFEIHHYWDFNFPREEDLPVLPDQEYAEQFQSLLDESVKLRMRADVPVGCYLSGGIDSCTVLALMARHSSAPIRAFSLKFDSPTLDESTLAREMATHAGTVCDIVPIKAADIADNFSDAIWHAETFFLNPNSVAKFILSRAVRSAGFKVVLTGEGSDEIVAGYPHFRQDLYSNSTENGAKLLRDLNEKNSASRGLLLASSYLTNSPILVERLGYSPAFMGPVQEISRQCAKLFSASASTEQLLTSFLDNVDIGGQLSGRHVVNQSLYLWNKSYLPGTILTVLGDRMEMAHSIEGRLPFLDHRLVEFTRSLPVAQKIKGTTEKFVLREAMRPLLPRTVAERQKHPFLAPPLLSQPDEPLYGMMQDTLRGSALNRIPLIEKKAVVEILDSLPSLDAKAGLAWEAPLMALFSAAILSERFHL